MAYSTYPTVISGDLWTAANNNTYNRDNFAALWQFTTAGDITYATSSSVLARLGIGNVGDILQVASGGAAPEWQDFADALGIQSDVVDTNEATSSDSYVDLSTAGPAITLTVKAGGKALILFGAGRMYNSTAGSFAIMGVEDSDSSGVISAAEVLRAPGANNAVAPGWRGVEYTGLTPGSVTFTCKYKRATSGSAGFGERTILGLAV